MATFTPTPDNGNNLIKKLAQGTYIDAFDYDMFEAPDTAQSLVMPYGNDIIGFQQLAGYIDYDDMSSDELAWFSTGRLLKSYDAVPVAANIATFPAGHDVRKNDTLKLINAAGLYEAIVLSVSGNDAELSFRTASTIADADFKVIHLATEFKKGTDVQEEWLSREGVRKTNKPIIVKDSIQYTRSDLAQIVQFAEGNDQLWSIDTSDMEARFLNQQVMAGVWGKRSESGSTADGNGYGGMSSLYDSVVKGGNTMAGSIDAIADIQALTRMLTANKSPKEYLLLQDLEYHQKLTLALGGINRMDTDGYNFGAFANVGDKIMDLNFRGFDSDGFTFAYKTWDVLNDQMYFGAFDGEPHKPKGMIIPAGEVPNAKGEILPYFSFVYRTGARRIVGRDGQVFGQGTNDVAKLGYTAEFTTRTVAEKDFSLIIGA
jgi:hypothetical protein